jgi:hypothetical protein
MICPNRGTGLYITKAIAEKPVGVFFTSCFPAISLSEHILSANIKDERKVEI